MKAFPKARTLMSAGLFLTICAGTVNGALASKLTAYVCTKEDQDASSQFSNSNGGQQLVVTTAANGDASAGAVVSSVEGNEIFQNLTFKASGPISATEGPFVYVYGNDAAGRPTSLSLAYGQDKVTRRIGTSYLMRYSGQVILKKGKKPVGGIATEKVVIAFYPNSKSNTYTVSNVALNGTEVPIELKTDLDCPVLSEVP